MFPLSSMNTLTTFLLEKLSAISHLSIYIYNFPFAFLLFTNKTVKSTVDCTLLNKNPKF